VQTGRQDPNQGVQFRHVLHLQGDKERLQSCQQKAELKANRNPEGRQEVQKTIEPILAAGVITLA
jgi:hypothetical protein